MKMFKKVMALLLAIAMTLAFTACTLPGNLPSVNIPIANNTQSYTTAQIDTMLSTLETTLIALIDENTSSIAQLESEYGEKLDELKAKDKTITKDITAIKKDYAEKIEALEAKISALDSEKGETAVDYSAKISELEAADAATKAALEELEAAYEAKVEELDSAIAENKSALEALEAAYESKIAELVKKDNENTKAIADLKAEYEAKIEELEQKLNDGSDDGEDVPDTTLPDTTPDVNEPTTDTDSAEITALREKIEELKGKLLTLEEKGTENAAAIAALRTEYEAKVAEILGKITECECDKNQASTDYSAAISALQSAVGANATAISALRAEYEAKIAELEGKITECECEKDQTTVDYTEEIEALEIEIAAVNAEIATLKSSYDARISALENNGTTLGEIDATLSKAGKAADAKATGDAIAEINDSVSKLTSLLQPKSIYGYVYTVVDTTSEEALARNGYYLGTNGAAQKNSAYSYSQMIEVLPGDVVHLTGYYPNNASSSLNYSKQYSIRMICVYTAEGVAKSSLGLSVGSGFLEFTVPEGGAYVAPTYTMGSFKNGFVPVVARYTPVGETFVLKDDANSASVVNALLELETLKLDVESLKSDVASLDAAKIQELSDNIVDLNAKIDALDVDALNAAIDSIKNLDTNGLNIMVNAALGSSSILATADKLVEGTPLQLENNTIINNKNLTFTCDIGEGGLGEGVVRLGHGKEAYGASYVEITATKLSVYSYASGPSLLASVDHGLTISDYLTVTIDADYHWAEINIATSTGNYKYAKNWQGRNGAIFAEVEKCEVTDVSMRWFSEEYRNPIWMVGDSYFNSKDESRWTSYLVSTGYKNFLMMSYPGMKTERGLTEVKQALNHGTPQYIVWCMGMNNGDDIANQKINSTYLEATEEFLAICKEKGITPILTTIPSTPTVLNEYKNEWVREWARTTGGRYIDFSRAVCNETYDASLIGQPVTNTSSTSEKTNKTGYQWYDNMLHGDAVHPGKLGAFALFMQALVDFPELMREK